MVPAQDVVAYTAGFFDGEGCIQFSERRFTLSCSQSESNAGETIMRGLWSDWGGLGSVCCCRHSHKGQNWNQWGWNISSAPGAVEFLGATLPFLRVKRAKAELCLAAARHAVETRRHVWTPAMDELIRQHWRTHTQVDLGTMVGRTETAVRHRGRKLGLEERPRRGWPGVAGAWSPLQDATLRRLHGKMQYASIGLRIGKTAKATRARAGRLGLPDLSSANTRTALRGT